MVLFGKHLSATDKNLEIFLRVLTNHIFNFIWCEIFFRVKISIGKIYLLSFKNY